MTKFCDAVFDTNRNSVEHGTANDAITFEPAQTLGQYLLRKIGQGLQYSTEARLPAGP